MYAPSLHVLLPAYTHIGLEMFLSVLYNSIMVVALPIRASTLTA